MSEPQLTVMVVDDHPIWRDAVARDLEDSGFTVVATADGVAAAGRRAAVVKPKVVLMDMRLSDGSGVEATTQVLAVSPASRVLVLSACGGSPYSFGPDHYVADAFRQAGFQLAETAPRIRHLREGEEMADILTAVERLKPDIVFSLDRENAEQCNAQLGMLPVRLETLRGEAFYHPGPGVLQGLDELAARMNPKATGTQGVKP